MKRRNFLWYSLLLITGCTTATSKFNDNNPTSARPEKLRFAVTDAKGLKDLERDYEPFRAVLEEILDIEVEFFPVENYFAATPAMLSGQLDLVWSGASEYLVLSARAKAVPIVGITRPEYYTVIAVRADSGIESVADLKGKTIDVRKEGSTASHLGAIELLMNAGLDPKVDIKTIASKDYSLNPLKTGEADAWSRTSYRYEQALEQEGASEREYPLIARGKPLPSDVLVVSDRLDSKFVEELRSRLLENQDKLTQAILSVATLAFRFQGTQLVPASDTDYDTIREVYRAIGQDDYL
ncbi:MAG: PhnD/SsuA/transferrin family substrate-binding protein [Cyanobacteria bacterium SBC]|nr:PhnD/SsuA/transferrin family substrate-binding protein [Cyanobacteria bacterium SBC]